MKKRGMILWAVLLCSACGGDDPLPTISIEDKGDFCEAIGVPYCERVNECTSEPSCETDFMLACCVDDGECNLSVDVEEQDVAECIDAIEAQTCAQVTGGNIPAECLNF